MNASSSPRPGSSVPPALIPPTHADEVLAELARPRATESSVREFLRRVDAAVPEVHRAFARVYGDDARSALLAVKAINLAVARFQYLRRATRLVSRPIQLMVDPSNACQLRCPGCVHSSRPELAAAFAEHWPPAMLSADRYAQLLDRYGPWAFGAVLYNYGEPLLNRHTPSFIARARRDLLFTLVSTNLSHPKLDVDALVASGLNQLIVSIDGVTQETYGRYRRRGRLDVVLENLRRVVAAKRRLRLRTPYVVWQFLTFEHNEAEAEPALALARELGVDAFHFLTPFDVSWDDPSCRAIRSPREGYQHFTPLEARLESLRTVAFTDEDLRRALSCLEDRWQGRMAALAIEEEEPPLRPGGGCGWLYKGLSMDGAGRLLPCCDAPSPERHLVFGSLEDHSGWNAPGFRLGRLALADRAAFDAEVAAGARRPHCAACAAISTPAAEPPHNLWRITQDLPALDPAGVLSRPSWNGLLRWE